MNKKTRIIRITIAAVLAAAFAGSGATTLATAMHVAVGARLYVAAVLAAALSGLAALSGIGGLAALGLTAIIGGGWAMARRDGLRAIADFLAAWRGAEADPARVTPGAGAFLVVLAAVLGALFFLCLYRRELVSLAVMILLALLVSSHAMSETTSIGASVPALVACAAAFALTGGIQRDASAARILVPAVLAAVLALLLMPAGRVTWGPLEDLGARMRAVFEQYFSFTHERIAFSIGEKGYNRGGEVDGQAVAMLGGPAQPDAEPVMRVTADGELLLRGTIRTTYTGYSWIDVTPKNRYLYFDITHRGVRGRVFDLDMESPTDAFKTVSGEVELLDHGTSTLFVPARMNRFTMDLSNAVFYNSSGEMFMAREVEPGDHYGVQALVPIYGDGLKQAVLWGETSDDSRYSAILSANTALPDGIDERVYALTIDLTRDAGNAYDRAEAIANYLRGNMRYRLDVEYPPDGRDFVSWFVLDSKEGYCSYFASAMAVMGRIAGLPTRYVEGYLARPGEDGTAVLSGRDAHAWAEVYFRGVGWVPFDATNGGPGRGEAQDDAADGAGDQSGEEAYGSPSGGQDDATATEAPGSDLASPSPNPDADGESGDGNAALDSSPQDEPTPTPEPDGYDFPEDPFGQDRDETQDDREASSDDPNDPDADEPDPGRSRAAWIVLIILLLLLIVALIALWVRGRLRRSDPVRLCAQSRKVQASAMIAYRANLTLLAQLGCVPSAGETPDAFARRAAAQFECPDYVAFAQAVTAARYGRQTIRRTDVACGLRAYAAFMKRLGPMDRARYTLLRVFRGLGDFEQIP